ncbi:unnamed protein product [Bacillus thuringiensis DB27]|uniref:Uncharacterized protein n=1 Tax=Bacillus thuringiensis DB27 TaxID=1431339 RepID=W8YLH5_BACTU|nr:unnamed protein product [Bacillus thuringiensis DB27]
MWNEFEGRKRYDGLNFKERYTEKQILDEFLQHCEKKQIEAIQKNDPLLLCTWIKEARLARRELIALYREKEKYDNQLERDRKSILGIVEHLKIEVSMLQLWRGCIVIRLREV